MRSITRDARSTQADRIISKFGGVTKLLRALEEFGAYEIKSYAASRQAVYRWVWPVEKGGSGGLIPVRVLDALMRIAAEKGIEITMEDLFPWKEDRERRKEAA